MAEVLLWEVRLAISGPFSADKLMNLFLNKLGGYSRYNMFRQSHVKN
jgi:hypothetical protein